MTAPPPAPRQGCAPGLVRLTRAALTGFAPADASRLPRMLMPAAAPNPSFSGSDAARASLDLRGTPALISLFSRRRCWPSRDATGRHAPAAHRSPLVNDKTHADRQHARG